ncbi:MAG: ubiquinone biosynthesis protein UbiE [Myxococcales bacterium]|nr:ubiquinone biosynthesis protein UbiE [Myxococcales bacterium]
MRQFHAAHPGITGRAFARGGSYDQIAALVPPDARVLDLACGDGVLLAKLGPHAIGLDVSREELGRIPRGVQGRAQALPFADASFDVCTCHLAFMLFDEVDRVVAELARVLVPGGAWIALLGGGPTATGDDAFHRFLAILAEHARAPLRLGEPRARTERGWQELFAGWREVSFERLEIDLGGSFDEVWAFLGASYEVPAPSADAIRDQLRAATAGITDATGSIPCQVVTWLARAVRAS